MKINELLSESKNCLVNTCKFSCSLSSRKIQFCLKYCSPTHNVQYAGRPAGSYGFNSKRKSKHQFTYRKKPPRCLGHHLSLCKNQRVPSFAGQLSRKTTTKNSNNHILQQFAILPPFNIRRKSYIFPCLF